MRFSIRATAVTLAALVPCALSAQDSLRVLRLQPQSPATPLAPIVVMFDHPVAPRLDQSVDPRRVLRIVPEVGARMYWRDPSTIVAEFDSPWAPGSSYEVRVDPRLRSVDGLPLAAPPTFRINVEVPRALGLFVTGTEADTILRPLALYTGGFDVSALVGHAWFDPAHGCGSKDSLPMTPTAIRPVSDADPASLRNAFPDRDRRLDSFRRVVELTVPGVVARGCGGVLLLPRVIGQPVAMRQLVDVPAPFNLNSITCSRECVRGQVVLDFTRPITAEEVRAHVRVNGQPARYSNNEATGHIVLPEVSQTRESMSVSVDAALANRAGERLGHDTTVVITGLSLAPAVGFRSGLLMSPPDAPFLLKVRHRNTDSITVVIGRVTDSVRATALMHHSYFGDMYSALLWGSVVSDTVVRTLPSIAPEDSERVIDLPMSLVPEAWRSEPLLLVRVQPTEVFKPSVIPERMPNVVRPPVGSEGRTPRFAVLQRSNITAHAWTVDERTEVWVTTLREAAPRLGATVRLFDDSLHVLAAGVTDARGRVSLRSALANVVKWQPFHVEVAYGKDRTFLNVSRYPSQRAVSTADDSLGSEWSKSTVATGFGTRWLHGAAFTDRGIYRPGERVYFGGAARTYDAKEGYRVPASDSARWTVWRANYEGTLDRIWSGTGPLSDFGTRSDSFTIDRTARLGTYITTLAIRDGRNWRTAARTQFRVAEYRAPEFAVTLDEDTSKTLFGGDTAKVGVNAKYLFGVPLAGGNVRWSSTYQENEPWDESILGLAGFNVGGARWRESGQPARVETAHSGNGTIADDGFVRIDVPTAEARRPGVLSVSVSVADVNRRDVTSKVTIPIHAADAYLGMRPRERRWFRKPGDSIVVELLLVRPNGTPRVGDRIAIVAERSRWIEGKLRRDTVWSTTATSAATPTTITFTPREGGSYELIGEARDERGRRAITGLYLWVSGGTPWWNQASRAITMRADRTRYAPGDTASLFVESPFEQNAWLTVGHEGMLAEQFVALRAGINDVHVPIPANAGRAVTMRMVGIRPYGRATGADTGGVYYRSAELTLQLDTLSRSLRVAVAPSRERYAPGDSVRVSLDVRDATGKGRRSELTVWAVDEGVIALTAFVRPAMLAMLLASNGESPSNGSTLLAMMLSTAPAVGRTYLSTFPGTRYDVAASVSGIRIRGASTLGSVAATGTAEGSDDAPLRSRFATTPFFTGQIRSDSVGRATTSFQLPDNISAFRIFAVAIGEDVSAGSADTSIISTRDLVVRPALPRIVRVGDELFAGAVLTKEGAGRGAVALSVEATNARVIGDATQRDTLDGQRPRELRFPLQITGGDTASFIFRGATLSGASMSDAVEARLAVSPPGRARAHVVTGMLERAGTATLALPAGTDTVRSHVSLQLGVSPLPLVRQFSEALRIYPYYCTEQVSSAGRALLARLKLERVVNTTTTLTARDRTQLETGVLTLLGRQRDDGGFGYWSATNWTSPWLTTYALEFLLGARDAGIAVPDNAVGRARKFLVEIGAQQREMRADPAMSRGDSLGWPHDALATASMLRRIGAPDLALENMVWKMRDSLGFEDRLVLADISAAQSDTARAVALLDAAWSSARLEGRRVVLDDSVASFSWLFRSTLRPAALLLATTARLQPRHPRIGALFESIVQLGRSESARWWNTIDQAAVAEGLTAAAATMGLATERDVAVAGPRGRIATVTLAQGRADSIQLAMASLNVPVRDSSELRLTLSSSSPAPTYYAMTLFEIPLARPVRADDAGIGVERWYESYDGGKPITEVREGELVRVRLRITAPADREFVVIDDALPAGLEAVDLSLRTSASLPPFEGAPRLRGDVNEGPPGQRWLYGSWDSSWWTPWEHKEIRDDRVLYFARQLWKGSYQASYVARATTAGTFVRPPAQAEEMYNPAVRGRSDGGTFTVTRAPR